jgi:hypothetical protein
MFVESGFHDPGRRPRRDVTARYMVPRSLTQIVLLTAALAVVIPVMVVIELAMFAAGTTRDMVRSARGR